MKVLNLRTAGVAAIACAAANLAVPAEAVLLSFTVNAQGTRFDAVLVAASAPNPTGTTSCLGSPGMERICLIGLSPFRSFSFVQDFDLSTGMLNYDDMGDLSTTGRTRFTLSQAGANLYQLTNFKYDFNNRTMGGTGVGRSEALLQTGLPLFINATPGVPEPATWAMMIGGFGLIGGAMRRRRVAISFA